jgi:hypothetical protein
MSNVTGSLLIRAAAAYLFALKTAATFDRLIHRQSRYED